MTERVGIELSLRGKQQFVSGIRDASDAVEELGDDAQHAGRQADTAAGHIRHLDRQASGLNTSTTGVSRGGLSLFRSGLSGLGSMAKMGSIALGALGVAAGAVGVSMLRSAMDAGETQSKYNTVFAGVTEYTDTFVKYYSTLFGIPTAQLQDALSTFGVFGQAAGVAQEDLGAFSVDLVKAGTDMASFYNAPIEDVFLALRSGLAGETEPLRKFGIFLSESALSAKAAEMGYSGAFSELADADKVLIRQSYILENLGAAQGDQLRTMDSLANQWKGFKGRLVEAGTAIGTALLPYAQQLLKWANSQMPRAMEWLQGALGRLPGTIDRIGKFVSNLRNQTGNLSAAFAAEGSRGAAEVLDNMFGNTGKLIPVFDAIITRGMRLWRFISKGLWPAFKSAKSILPAAIGPLKLADMTLKFLADHAEELRPILVGLLAGFLAFKTVTTVIGLVTKTMAALNLVMAMNPIVLVVAAVAALAAGFVYAYKHSETFRNFVNGLWDALKAGWQWISDNWPLLLAILTGPFGLAALAIVENWDTIKNGFTEVKDWISDKVDDVVGFITGIPGRIEDTVATMWDGIKESFRSVMRWIVERWNGIQFKLPSFGGLEVLGKTVIPSFEGPTLGVPQIDPAALGLADGGTTGSAGWYDVGERGRERVFLPMGTSVRPLPLAEKLDPGTMSALTEGGDIVIQIDGREIYRVAKRYARKEMART